MKMECLADYDILSNDLNLSSKFVVKHRATEKLYCIQSILSKDLTEIDQKALTKKLSIRIAIRHPNILQFHGHFHYNDVLYIKQDFCKHGTLACFIQKECIAKNRQLHENLICRMLYQSVLALKTMGCFMGELSLDTILLNEEFNIKLYNFPKFTAEKNKSQKQKEIKMSHLGAIMIELCTLKPFETCNFEADIQKQNYSDNLKALLVTIVKDNTEIKKHINKMLCHPTILLQSTEWNKSKCFIENNDQTLKKSSSSSSDCLENAPPKDHSEKVEKLKRKEVALQMKEQLLKEQERKLAHREKKIQIMERTVKEKLQQAELYLKRCREGGKSISSGSSKSSSNSQSTTRSKKMLYEETDPDYVTCGDSDVFPTSTKLQVDQIVKPQNFSRTLSERRIRFKTSPLKDHNFTRKGLAKRSLRHSKIFEEHVEVENVAPNVQADQNEDTTRRKTLFPANNYENDFIVINEDCNKIPCEIRNRGWTEETKRYAFEMLRLMNDDEKENADVKHTFL